MKELSKLNWKYLKDKSISKIQLIFEAEKQINWQKLFWKLIKKAFVIWNLIEKYR